MIGYDELRNYIGRIPFQPFRVTLVDGETVDVSHQFRAVATARDLVVATKKDRLRWIQLDRIVKVDVQTPREQSH